MLKFLEVQDLFCKVQGWSYKILYKVILPIFQHKHLNIPAQYYINSTMDYTGLVLDKIKF